MTDEPTTDQQPVEPIAEPVPDVVDAPVEEAPVLAPLPADGPAPLEPIVPLAPSEANPPAQFSTVPAEPQIVTALQYDAPTAESAGNLDTLVRWIGADAIVTPQPSFNPATGQTCIHISGDLTQPGDYVVKHPSGIIVVVSAEQFAELYTAK